MGARFSPDGKKIAVAAEGKVIILERITRD
jgi:hypothetical protein